MKAYDVTMLTWSVDRAASDNQGWVFGLPPGIAPEQWPLDPISGYPLVHGFTLLLPEEYRIHGPDIVALSFFATAADQNDGGAIAIPGLTEAVRGEGESPPDDPDLRPYWEVGRRPHPRLHRMQDILDYEYAVILLTQAEFDGPLCPPPAPLPSGALKRPPAPNWLTRGAGAAYWEFTFSPSIGLKTEDTHLYRSLGGVPEPGLDFNRALSWTPRAADPNAGKAPRESWTSEPGDYQLPYFWLDDKIETENYREHDWAKDHAVMHIGGTMRPIQGIPEFSPYYIEFEEYFGGYNFGGGNAQLDFKDMKFDWACG